MKLKTHRGRSAAALVVATVFLAHAAPHLSATTRQEHPTQPITMTAPLVHYGPSGDPVARTLAPTVLPAMFDPGGGGIGPVPDDDPDDGGGGSDTPDDSGSEDDSNNTDDADGTDDSGGSDDSGSSDDSDDEAEAALDAERAAVTEATEAILDDLNETRDACRRFDAEMAAAALASDYQRSGDALTAASDVAASMQTATQSFVQSGDDVYTGVHHRLNERQRRLRERYVRESAREVGDPIRISDGQFTFEAPMPVIRHWELSVDLTLRYDGARNEHSDFGSGWWWEPAQRTVSGVRPLPEMEPVLQQFEREVEAGQTNLSAAYHDTFGTTHTVGDADAELAELIDEWNAALEVYAELLESLTELEVRAASDPVMAPRVAEAVTEVEEIIDTSVAELDRYSGSLEFLQVWNGGRAALTESQATLSEADMEFDRYRAQYTEERTRQDTHLPSGSIAEMFEIGSTATAFFDDQGALHTFTREHSDRSLTTTTLPWHHLISDGPDGHQLREPSGTTRYFDDNGRLVRIEDPAGHALRFDRDHHGRLTSISDETGATRAVFSWSRSQCEIEIPSIASTAVTMEDRTIHRIAGPRGTLDFRYQNGALARVERSDGSWTAVHREDGEPNRVIAVEQSTGATERLRYESDHRRVYIDPDGYETFYEMAANRVRSVQFASGLSRWFEYDERGRLTSWTDNRGGGARLTYDARGAQETVEWGNGTSRRVTRDDQGRITRVESDRGTIATYRYGPDGTVIERSDATGKRLFFTPGDDNSVSIATQRGPLAEINRDSRGNPVDILRSDGRHHRSLYDELNRKTHTVMDGTPTEERRYDRAGRLQSITTADGQVSYEYDASGNVVQIRRNGTVLQEREYDPVGHLMRRRYYDGGEEVIERTVAGRVVALVHRDGSRWRIAYDGHGRPSEITETTGRRRRTFAYAGDGRVMSIDDTSQGVVEFLYSEHGEHQGYRYPDGSVRRRVHRPGGRVELNTPTGETVLIDLDGGGRPRRVRDESGETVTYHYRDDHTVTTRDGTIVRTAEVDRFGRLTAIRFPDGTQESWSYSDGGRTRVFTDRRGAVHTERRDHWQRPVSFTAGDGYRVRWTYGEESVQETRSDGTTRTYQRDTLGAVTEERTSHLTTRHLADDDGGYHIETRTTQGNLLSRLFFDARNRLVEQWSRIGGTIYEADFPAPGIHDYRLLGYVERREEVVPGMHVTYAREGDPHYRVEQLRSGAVRRIRADEEEIASMSWVGTGLPSTITVQSGDEHVEHAYTYAGTRLESYQVPGQVPRRYRVDDSRNEVSIEAGEARREITTDPYGAITAETITLPHLPVVNTSRTRDIAGRPVTVETHINDAAHRTGQTIEYLPHRQGATVTGGAASLEIHDGESETTITIDGDHTIRADRDAVELADTLSLAFRHGADGATSIASVARLSRSGFSEVLDAVTTVRNADGQVTAEQRVDGRTQVFRYGRGGRLKSASGGTAGVIEAVPTPVARALSASWQTAGISVTPPEPPSVVNQRDLLYASRRRARRDAAGRIAESEGTTITYDETSGRPQRVTNSDGGDWTVVRDARGDPVLVIDSERGRRWTCSTIHYESHGGPLVVRHWSRHDEDPGDSIARYREGATDGTDPPQDPSSCVEVSQNGRVLFLVDAAAIYMPFTDLRSTTRGLSRVDRTSGLVRYQRWSDVLPEVSGGTLSPPEDGPQFPAAVPYDRVVYGMLHVPGTRALWGRERVYLPDLGSFTSVDPALHHLDWFEYAAGDPVNFLDREGLRFIPIHAGHTHFQQEGWWNEEPLGSRSITTVGSSGCVLTGVSNMINTISGDERSNPGTLNWYCRDGFFRDGNLLATEDTEEILQAATGHHIETVSFDPQTVDMTRVAAAIEDDTIQQYAATARIRTYRTNPDGTVDEYQHTVNVAGFDEEGAPIIHDTSSRNRTSLDQHEEVLRYDVYAVSNCRGY